MEYFTERERKIPVADDVDVLVAGGGVSGIVAAVAAARNGARTLLVERLGWLAGHLDAGWGAGTVGFVFQDAQGKQIMKGICWELLERIKRMGAALGASRRRFLRNTWPYKTENRVFRPQIMQEAGKQVAFEMVEEAGVRLLLHTFIADVVVEDSCVKGIIIENKSGRQALLAKVVVDCTGDADIAARAGVPFDQTGKEKTYQVSRSFLLANVDTEAIRRKIVDHVDEYAYVMEPLEVPEGLQHPIMAMPWKVEDLEVTEDGRHLKGPKGSHSSESVGIMAGIMGIGFSVDGVDGTNAWEVSRAEVQIRKKVFERWLRLRRERAEYADSLLLPGSVDLGVRETRRIRGEYTITMRDIDEGRRFEDAIAQSMIALDCHHPGGVWEELAPKDTYDLPYRILVPKRIEGLLVAGRCVSTDHMALAALRKIPVCMALGQAAGTAAALSASKGVFPRNLDISELQRTLLSQDVPLRDGLPVR
jgi:hypothetical protein